MRTEQSSINIAELWSRKWLLTLILQCRRYFSEGHDSILDTPFWKINSRKPFQCSNN